MSAESTPDSGTPEQSDTTGPRHRAAKGRRRKARGGRSKAVLVTVWTAAGILVLGGTGAGYLYFKLNGNIKSVDINQALGTDRPLDVDNGSQDILVLGSDTRSGSNKKLGGGVDDGSARSDTAMIVHVYEGHKKASVVSIPRDTLVDRPECTDTNGKTYPAVTMAMFNSAYSTGGAACAVKTVESMTGIRMDHYIEVDFAGFEKLINVLGGVDITTTKDIKDPDSHLNLKAGEHTLTGKQALGLVRTRHGVGDGSDLGRIQLQQAFIKALLEQVKEIGLLSSPAKLYDLADTATDTITTDSDLDSIKDLASFAGGLKGIGSKNMTMVTMPVQYDPADPNRVLVDEAKAKQVWAALKADRTIPKSATKGTAKGDADGVVASS
ncbi:putative transcriptional regulator [Streptomyces graminofaciens]|uniref:Transcriptional regulator n=1 Tax=Streptomyces graminofaciens TaxID=68212 RepID=A0ABM7FAC3_9ACTN|nr:LCP family protein [Streptomyces graminofaciens]BBC32953.1 putative transcriptional regulator [Streptomyces graminofaciens]